MCTETHFLSALLYPRVLRMYKGKSMIRLLDRAPVRSGGWSWREIRLLRRWRQAELIELYARRFSYQPYRFRWHGLLHTVRRIERVWEQVGGRSRHARRYFRVTCHDDQTYVLFQDLRIGSWYVEV